MEHSELYLRPGTPGDAPEVSAFCHASWLATYGPIIGKGRVAKLSRQMHRVELMREQAGDGGQFLVALSGREMSGHLRATPPSAGAVYLDRLHVAARFAGRGIGRALLGRLRAELAPGTRLWLNVLVGNDRALAFYRREGFTLMRTTGACGGIAGVPAHVMEMKL